MKANKTEARIELLCEAARHCGQPESGHDQAVRRWQAFCEPLAPRSVRALTQDIAAWTRWWLRSRQDFPMAHPESIRNYVELIETAGLKTCSVSRTLHSIKKFLAALGWPHPGSEELVVRFCKARAAPPLASIPVDRWFGWKDVEACIAVADDHCPMDVRNIAVLLVLSGTMALPDQVLGYREAGVWHRQPITKHAFVSRRDGSAMIRLNASHTTPAREAYLSQLAASWIARWLEMRPDCGAALFISGHGKPLHLKTWISAMHGLLLRAGIHPDRFTPRALRLGAARDLLREGTHIDDVRRIGGWKQFDSVVRLLEAPTREEPFRHLAQIQGHASPKTPEQLFRGRGPRTLRQSLLRKILPTTGDLFEPLRRMA